MDDKKTSGTETSAFGTPGHVSHDSSRFYQSRMYAQLDQGKKVKYIKNPIPEDVLDRIHCQSSESMANLPDASVHLMVTSPPYKRPKGL